MTESTRPCEPTQRVASCVASLALSLPTLVTKPEREFRQRMPRSVFLTPCLNYAIPMKAADAPKCAVRARVGIPVKVNNDSGGSRTAFRSEGEQQSERSDAGMVIVE